MMKRYDPLSPAALSMFKNLIDACKAAQKPLTVCGEMAGSPLEAMALIALGCHGLSLSASNFDAVKLMLRSLHVAPLRAYLHSLLDRPAPSLRPLLLAYAKDHGVDLQNYR